MEETKFTRETRTSSFLGGSRPPFAATSGPPSHLQRQSCQQFDSPAFMFHNQKQPEIFQASFSSCNLPTSCQSFFAANQPQFLPVLNKRPRVDPLTWPAHRSQTNDRCWDDPGASWWSPRTPPEALGALKEPTSWLLVTTVKNGYCIWLSMAIYG